MSEASARTEPLSTKNASRGFAPRRAGVRYRTVTDPARNRRESGAYGILALLPVELVINIGSGAGYAMVFALLLSAILWNLGTWYLGLPASSSHTLIGAIMGVGLANSMLQPGHVFGEGVPHRAIPTRVIVVCWWSIPPFIVT